MKKLIIPILVIIVMIVTALVSVNLLNVNLIVTPSNTSSKYNSRLNTTTNYLIHKGIINYTDVFNEEYFTIKIVENEKESVYKYSDLGINISFDKNSIDYINSTRIIEVDKLNLNFDYSNLSKEIECFNLNRHHPESARIIKENDIIKVIEEHPANFLMTERLIDYIIENLGNPISINLNEFYEDFNNNHLRNEQCYNELSKFINTYVAYDNETELHLNNLIDFIDVIDNKIVLVNTDTEEYYNTIKNWVVENLETYNTVGKSRIFTTTNGETVEIIGGTWGDICDFELETNYIINLFNVFSCEEDRIPILEQDYDNGIPSTYIEISITDQYLWYYKDNELFMESKVVTGTKGKYDTPHGIYYISEKIDGKYLRGDDYVTWVNKWLRITNRGHGLHDATWRSSFGGKIYTYNGSHGCINLPKKFAYDLFDNVETKTCVIIY